MTTNTPLPHAPAAARSSRGRAVALAAVFLIVTLAGLMYVKWWPYYHKAANAADTHSIGSSILGGASSESLSDIARSAYDYSIAYFKSVWKAAVLGLVVSSMIQALLPANWLAKAFGKASARSTLIGGAASLPGMMCSCCAAPIAVGMRKRQASIGASLAFWIGNPTLNPATLVFMTFVLSWKFTVLRLVFGLILTFGISYLGERFADRGKLGDLPNRLAIPEEPANRAPLALRWLKSLALLFLGIAPIYAVSVFLAGCLQSFMLPAWASEGIVAIVLFAVIGTLFVIPTAAEIPIAQSLLSVGTGPAAALLLTLPGVSLPSLLIVSRSFPKRVLLFVTLSVMALGVLCGIAGSLWL